MFQHNVTKLRFSLVISINVRGEEGEKKSAGNGEEGEKECTGDQEGQVERKKIKKN